MAAVIRGTLNNRYLPHIEFATPAPALIGSVKVGPVRWYDRSEVPEDAILSSPHKSLPEFLAVSGQGAASAAVKDLIESLEPGRHQFFPVTIRRARGDKPILLRDGSVLDAPYYVMYPGVHLDAVWIDRSPDVRVTGTGLVQFSFTTRERGTVLRRSMTTGHHFWCGNTHLAGSTFFSDELAKAVVDRNWKGLEFKNIREE